MRRTFRLALMLAALAISTQHASAQLAEKKVLTLAAAAVVAMTSTAAMADKESLSAGHALRRVVVQTL